MKTFHLLGFIGFLLTPFFIMPFKNSSTSSDDPIEGYAFVHLIPDSLRTPEQRQLLDKLARVMLEHLEVKDNHLVFGLSKKEFLQEGIPEPYYYLLMEDLENNNRFIDEHPEECANYDIIFHESFKDLYQQYGIQK